MSNKQKIPAVFKEDLIGLLKSIGEHKALLDRNRLCQICSTPIYLDNIQLIIPVANNKFLYICNSIQCIEQYTQQEKAE